MTEPKFFDEIINPQSSDWLLVQQAEEGGIVGKVAVVNLPITAGITDPFQNASEITDPLTNDYLLLQRSGGATEKVQIANLPGIDFDVLPEAFGAANEDQLLIKQYGEEDGLKKISVDNLPLAPLVHGHQINSIANLQNALDSKANATDIAATVSALQLNIDGKASISNGIDKVISQVEKTNPSFYDYVLIQQNDSDKFKAQIINLPFQTQNWASVSFGTIRPKSLIDTSLGDVTLYAPSLPSTGTEFLFKRLQSSNKVLIKNLQKFNSQLIDDSASEIRLNYVDEVSRLIYVDSVVGWTCVPNSGISKFNDLLIPMSGIRQIFYANNLNLFDNDLVFEWQNPLGNNAATQNIASNQPTFKKNIFSKGRLPGVFFSSAQWLSNNFSYLSNQKYIILIVEQRQAGYANNYFMSAGTGLQNGALVLGYRNSSTLTFSQYVNDLDFTIPSYTVPNTRIVTFVSNDEGKAIWINNNKVASNTNTVNAALTSSGFIGKFFAESFGYTGYIGLLTTYVGHKTDTQVQDIISSVNFTFEIY